MLATFAALMIGFSRGGSPPEIAFPASAVSAFTPSPVAPPLVLSLVMDVSLFGAVPDDGRDDTVAIQRALDAVNAANGGTLVFAAGRYDISIVPSLRRALTLYPRLRLLARPGAPATLRLADNQPIYESVMATASYPTRLDDAEFVGMIFDSNGLANPVRDPEETNGGSLAQLAFPTLRYFIRSFAGSRVRIANAVFINADTGNTVSFNGMAVSDIIIENSKFLNVGGVLIDHDHSSVYFYGRRLRLSNNEFRGRNGARTVGARTAIETTTPRGRSPRAHGTVGARTAIETHGDDVEVRENIVDGFLQGANVVGRMSDPSRQLFVRNRFTNVAVGVNIWPLQDALAGSAFVDLIVRDNEISIDAERWWRSVAMVVGLAAGIHFEAEIARARLDRLDITGNRISYLPFSGERADADRVSVGIGIRGVENVLTVSNLSVVGNMVSNAIGPCILSTAIIALPGSSRITGNTLSDCARSRFLVGEADILRTAIAIGGTTSNLTVSANTIGASGLAPATLTGILIGANCAANCIATGNTVTGIAQAIANRGTGWVVPQ